MARPIVAATRTIEIAATSRVAPRVAGKSSLRTPMAVTMTAQAASEPAAM